MTTKTKTPHLEKIVIDSDSGELLALGDHPVVLREALEGAPGVAVDLVQGAVRISGLVAGQPTTATYTIRGQSLDGSAWALSRRY